MLFVVLYTTQSNGRIEPIMINPGEHSKEELLKIVNAYKDVVRVALEFVIGGRTFFRYNLNSIDNLKHIDFFKSYGAGTTSYSVKSMSAGFIDKLKGIRVEYMQDGIRVYQLK